MLEPLPRQSGEGGGDGCDVKLLDCDYQREHHRPRILSRQKIIHLGYDKAVAPGHIVIFFKCL